MADFPAESNPFVGIGVLIADTGYELYAGCESMQYLDELSLKLGVDEVANYYFNHKINDIAKPGARSSTPSPCRI